MRVLWLPVLACLADLAVPARADTLVAPLGTSADTGDRATAHDAPVPATASSTPSEEVTQTDLAGGPIALGVSSPFGWFRGSFGVSAYVGLGRHHAVRADFARYQPLGLTDAMSALAGGDGSGYSGTIADVGIGWVWYPRRRWDGFMAEAGAIRRACDTQVWPEFDPKVRTKSTTYAGRMTIGWSWLVTQHLFIAISAGASQGLETGYQTITPDGGGMTTTKKVNRRQVDTEAYLRIGVVFGR